MNVQDISVGQYELVMYVFSFCVSAFAAASLFFWFGRSQVSKHYKTAMTITGLVTFIAFYNYWRLYDSWVATYHIVNGALAATGVPFDNIYRDSDWLLTVPLLLIELILVMRLPRSETVSRSWTLGVAAALMIVLGIPGGVSDGVNSTRLIFGVLSMIPFLYIVYSLYAGLGESIERQPDSARGLVRLARNLTVVTWFFYPIVYFLPFVLPMSGGTPTTVVQVGYAIADITAKVVFGLLIYQIAVRKSEAEEGRNA
ncbi:MAG: bacteriorhodopsin [Acidithiobacillus sp.]|uniref:bacteriorhodopsin-like n=1 Tax=Acidithiobacillus sp. TaxID=1872118 RepID=UPI002582A2DF|nr:bacteriorhodopsin-like [Acidithiobacillus sp.]MCE5421162.1 bacteriorhodopsin [Acidithiobacillus sp.]